jgi:hypothetical protein
MVKCPSRFILQLRPKILIFADLFCQKRFSLVITIIDQGIYVGTIVLT